MRGRESNPVCDDCRRPIPKRVLSYDGVCFVCYCIRRGDKGRAFRVAKMLAFACGPQFCKFCEDYEECAPCIWEGSVIDARLIHDARVGDVWITEQAGKRGRIVEIEMSPKAPWMIRLWVKIPGHPKPYPYDRRGEALFIGELQGTCRKQACWRHQREVSEGRVICMDHWDAWLERSVA